MDKGDNTLMYVVIALVLLYLITKGTKELFTEVPKGRDEELQALSDAFAFFVVFTRMNQPGRQDPPDQIEINALSQIRTRLMKFGKNGLKRLMLKIRPYIRNTTVVFSGKRLNEDVMTDKEINDGIDFLWNLPSDLKFKQNVQAELEQQKKQTVQLQQAQVVPKITQQAVQLQQRIPNFGQIMSNNP